MNPSSLGKLPTNNEPKPHVCPVSNATHPRDRWETAFVFAFITKFTALQSKIEGFESVTDLEEALLCPTQHPILVQTLSRFLLNLKPMTRNLSPDQLPGTLFSVLQEYKKSNERTVFWNEELGMSVDPLQKVEGGFWGADWDLKLRVLRQLVELQLTHNQDIRDTIDRAWGVVHNKHRKRDGLSAPPEPHDPNSAERLKTTPLGQDVNRKRYWAFDNSPRLYISTNPWKVSSEFKAISTNREEYLKVIENLGAEQPPKMNKSASHHLQLKTVLESRLETIDQELVRVQRVRRKIEQKEILKAQAELRTTRTRRQTHRPDYVYHQDFDDEEDGDDYTYQEEDDEQIEFDDEEFADETSLRRSQRTYAKNINGKRAPDGVYDWRVERRSTRLGANADHHISKRARTDERSVSSAASDILVSPTVTSPDGTLSKQNGAAAVRPNEIAVEQVPGKKKSKFWYYAVEPVKDSAGIDNNPHSPSDTKRLEADERRDKAHIDGQNDEQIAIGHDSVQVCGQPDTHAQS